MVNVNDLTDVIIVQAHGFAYDLRLIVVLSQRADRRSEVGVGVLVAVVIGNPAVAHLHPLRVLAQQLDVAYDVRRARLRRTGARALGFMR